MNNFVNKIIVLILPAFFCSCEHKKASLTENVWNYSVPAIIHDCKGCSKKIKKDIQFYVEHENKLDLSKYQIVIAFNGVAYSGKYQYPITIQDLCWCNEPSLNVSMISVSLIDKGTNKAYVYSQKNSFNLLNKSIVYIKLLNDSEKEKGEFKIKFDDDFFYFPPF